MSNETSAQRYLRLAFQLNPMWQSQQLIDLRARALRLPRLDKQSESQSEAQVDVTSLRQAARKHIADIQANFWKLPLDQLKRQLEMIDVRRLPELASVIGRLRTAAACRGEFPRLSQESWMDSQLFSAFKTAVVLPPADAGHVRESFLRRLNDKKQLKTIKNAIRRLEADYPVLYALERDWFQTMGKHKVRNVSADGGGGGSVSFEMPEIGWPIWLLVFFLIRVALRLMMSGGN